MNFSNAILDLSLRKVIRRSASLLKVGGAGVKQSENMNTLLGDNQAAKIASMPRYKKGEVKLGSVTLTFNDNVALYGMLDEIYIKKNYSFFTQNQSPIILDCGANIGIGVAYLKSRYPNAVIYAFEPDNDAFNCLCENVERNNFTDVHLYKNAVWVENKNLEFFSDGSWGGSVFPKNDSKKINVRAVDIGDFLNQPIDFLKMDIEGAETEVLQYAANKIINNVERLFFEWHSIKGAPQQLGRILSQFENSGFRYHIKEASNRLAPFDNIPPGVMDSQLDVFLYK